MHPKWINTSDNPSKYLSLQTHSMRKIEVLTCILSCNLSTWNTCFKWASGSLFKISPSADYYYSIYGYLEVGCEV